MSWLTTKCNMQCLFLEFWYLNICKIFCFAYRVVQCFNKKLWLCVWWIRSGVLAGERLQVYMYTNMLTKSLLEPTKPIPAKLDLWESYNWSRSTNKNRFRYVWVVCSFDEKLCHYKFPPKFSYKELLIEIFNCEKM